MLTGLILVESHSMAASFFLEKIVRLDRQENRRALQAESKGFHWSRGTNTRTLRFRLSRSVSPKD